MKKRTVTRTKAFDVKTPQEVGAVITTLIEALSAVAETIPDFEDVLWDTLEFENDRDVVMGYAHSAGRDRVTLTARVEVAVA
jgi:hypothetical protein